MGLIFAGLPWAASAFEHSTLPAADSRRGVYAKDTVRRAARDSAAPQPSPERVICGLPVVTQWSVQFLFLLHS